MEKLPTDSEKFDIVIRRNTFYFHNIEYEETYEGYITSLVQLLLLLKKRVAVQGLDKRVIIDFIKEKENGLIALLTLFGLSKESLLRLITFIRVKEDRELSLLVYKDKWAKEEFKTEWSLNKVVKMIKENPYFAQGIVNLLFEGSTNPLIMKSLPLFEFKKLDINKLSFGIETLIDSIVRSNVKGRYAAGKKQNPGFLIESALEKNAIGFDQGELPNISRTMDFIIPNKKRPKVVAEASYVVTTSSGMGDKAKTEIAVANQLKKFYPYTVFVGFVDGIGWYVRQGDLKRIVSAFENVFTFTEEEIYRFIKFVEDVLGRQK